ncbi:hypothetical protein Gotri_001032 [Gossypium trilobum]|uniref:Uncharacterized protein n=1 Tax=Gossypium trilobum TaxID=34281 RepID=A0A7J9FDE3_9ROSI|nr:hypothetical protein [Gossypium trilobum]
MSFSLAESSNVLDNNHVDSNLRVKSHSWTFIRKNWSLS